MTISVQVLVRLDARELSVTEEASGRDDVVPALNRARDRMVLVLARNGLADTSEASQ